MSEIKKKKHSVFIQRLSLEQFLRHRGWVLFFVIVFFDLMTKYWVAHCLPLMQFYLGYPFGGIGILHTSLLKISIVHTTNTGIAWGFLASYQKLLLFFRICITLGIFAYMAFFKSAKHIFIPLVCILAGAIGNVMDFFLYGHVIDMFYFIFYKFSYPVFNVADSAIFLSASYLFFFSKKTKTPSHVS